MKRTPLHRYTRLRSKRPTARRGEPTKDEKAALRRFVYDRAGGKCELRLKGCKRTVLPFEGDVFTRAHLVHLRARRRFGWHPETSCLGCYSCHIEQSHVKGVKLPATYAELLTWERPAW